MASLASFPFSIEGAATGTEGSALAAGFSLLASEIRTVKLINRVGLRNGTAVRCMRSGYYDQKTALRWGASGMRIGGGSWRILCSNPGDKDSSAEGEKEKEAFDDELTATIEKKTQNILALHKGILEKLDERRKLVAEFKLIIENPASVDTAQDSAIPSSGDLISGDKKDHIKEHDIASLSSLPDQSPNGQVPKRSTTVSNIKEHDTASLSSLPDQSPNGQVPKRSTTVSNIKEHDTASLSSLPDQSPNSQVPKRSTTVSNASLSSLPDQSPNGKVPKRSTTVSKANSDVGANNMNTVIKKDPVGLISSMNINYAPKFPGKSTSKNLNSVPKLPEKTTSRNINSVPKLPEKSTSRNVNSVPKLPEKSTSRSISSVPKLPEKSTSRNINSVPKLPEKSTSRIINSVPKLPENSTSKNINYVPKLPEKSTSKNISSVPKLPEKSTSRINSVPKLTEKSTSRNTNYVPKLPEKSIKKPQRSSSPEVISKKIEDRPDVSTRIPSETNGITYSLKLKLANSLPVDKAPLEGISDVIAEEIRKSVSAAAVSTLQEEMLVQPLVKEITGGTNSPSHDDVKPPPPPLAGENVMNVILVAAECSPWKKTGGLGDVAGALPKALARRGHRVMVVVPRYGNYADTRDIGIRKRYKVAGQDMEVNYFHTFIDGVDFVFIESPILRHIQDDIYGGNWMDILRRMTLFCKAAVEVPWHVPCGGIIYGDGNLVFIANDWHTALLPVYLKAYYRDNGLMTYTRSVLIIHNIAHQGRGPLDLSFSSLDLPGHYKDYFKLYDPVGGEHCNIFAAGIKAADRVVAVSHGYAWELKTNEGGWGLHNIINDNHWKLQGIVNGIDYNEWNPQVDEYLKSDGYTNYTQDTLLTGKAQCKEALQKELGLPVRPDVPLIGFIGRLDGQKGVDIIGEAIPWMMDQDVQLVMLGTGRRDLEDMLNWFENQYKGKVRGWVGFSVRTSHRITAGADILLMPSRFEPCGLNQLYAMCYGTIPVVHSVGGLRDTVHPYDPFSDTGYGWTFDRAECGKLIEALGYCLQTYREHKQSWEGIQRRGMMQDLSWDHAAQIYEEVLVAAKYQW